MEIRYGLILLAALALSSCSRELDLAHKYDNTESSKPFTEDTQVPEGPEGPDTDMQFTEVGGILLSDRVKVKVPSGIPRYGYMLDGKITVGKFGGSNDFTTFWSADYSMMQTGCKTPWLEDNIGGLKKNMSVIGKGVTPVIDGFTDGGMWFIGVHELPSGKLAGFFHAESHYPGVNSQYKSIGVSYSTDGGKTWDKGTKIISGPDPKPAVGEGNGKSYGLGDGCVVWNEARKQWICYYSGFCPDPHDFVISMAASSDPEGKPGTWKKWDGNDFTGVGCDQTTGLGDINYKVAGLTFRGGNPSVAWNTELEKWIMVYHTWGRNIVMSYSKDGIEWEDPVTIIGFVQEQGGSMYPNIISESGDLTCGKEFRVYYSADMDAYGNRDLIYRVIRLKD